MLLDPHMNPWDGDQGHWGPADTPTQNNNNKSLSNFWYKAAIRAKIILDHYSWLQC